MLVIIQSFSYTDEGGWGVNSKESTNFWNYMKMIGSD